MNTQSSRWRTLGLAGGIAVGLGLLIASSQAATPGRGEAGARLAGASRPAPAPRWFDVLHTEGGSIDLSRRPIAGHFFGPGYKDFAGTIAFDGRDFGVQGPFDFGNGDVSLLRMGPQILPQVGGTARFPAAIAAISWHSTRPVEVGSPSGAEKYDVEITLSRMADSPRGTMTLERDTLDGGTVSLEAEAVLRFRFYQPGGRQVVVDAGAPGMSFGQVRFEASGVAWSSRCTGSTLRTPRLSGGLCLGQTAAGTRPSWRFESPSISADLEAASRTALRTTARMAPGAVVASDTDLQDGVSIGIGAQVRAAGLGRDVQVGAGALIGERALVGLGSRLLDGAYVGPGSYLEERVVVGRRARLEQDVVVHKGTRIADQAVLGSGASVGGGTEIGRGATVGRNVKIGAGSHIGAGAWIKSSVSLAPRTTIAPGTVVTTNTITCMFGNGTTASMTVSQCQAQGGAIRGTIPPPPDPTVDAARSSFEVQEKQIVQGTVQGQQLGQLNNDVDNSHVAVANGGQPYSDPAHDCDDFADELERYLEAHGWNATFTCYWDLNPEYTWYNALWTDKWINGHCLTDVHLADGSYVWIEAQRSSRGGAVGVNLDSNGDGTVGVGTTSGNSATEGNRRIEVYGSRAEGERAGNRFD